MKDARRTLAFHQKRLDQAWDNDRLAGKISERTDIVANAKDHLEHWEFRKDMAEEEVEMAMRELGP